MTTRLDIVNAALGSTGVSPVSTYDSTHPDVQNIDPVINKVSKQVQKKGWWFNTDYELTLTAEVGTGKVIIPDNTLQIDPSDPSSKYVRRGKFLYDPVAHTFNIGESVDVDIIVELPINELPEDAALYILERVKHEYFMNDDGDLNKADRIEAAMNLAHVELKSAELKNSNLNINNRPAVLEMKSGIVQSGRSYGSFNPNYPGGRE